jgi:hypothetical protein
VPEPKSGCSPVVAPMEVIKAAELECTGRQSIGVFHTWSERKNEQVLLLLTMVTGAFGKDTIGFGIGAVTLVVGGLGKELGTMGL